MTTSPLFLQIYLRNPPLTSKLTGDPLIELPNGRRIVIETIDRAFAIEAQAPRADSFNGTIEYVKTYRVHHELSEDGTVRHRVATCADIEEVCTALAEQAAGFTRRDAAKSRVQRIRRRLLSRK